jgi:hypothetical protein
MATTVRRVDYKPGSGTSCGLLGLVLSSECGSAKAICFSVRSDVDLLDPLLLKNFAALVAKAPRGDLGLSSELSSLCVLALVDVPADADADDRGLCADRLWPSSLVSSSRRSMLSYEPCLNILLGGIAGFLGDL